MRSHAVLLGVALMSFTAAPAWSDVVISSDKGGQIGAYVARYQQIRQSGQRVVIDGPCFSACTIALGMIPRDRLCATPNAALGFHAAWFPDDAGGMKPNRHATNMLMKFYPPGVRQWIARRGGLNSELVVLQGGELAGHVPACGAVGAAAVRTARTSRVASAVQAGSSRRARATITPPAAAKAAMAR